MCAPANVELVWIKRGKLKHPISGQARADLGRVWALRAETRGKRAARLDNFRFRKSCQMQDSARCEPGRALAQIA